jgi:hypothetical protein
MAATRERAGLYRAQGVPGAAHLVVRHGTVLKADAAAATLNGWSLPSWQVTQIAPRGRDIGPNERFG